MDLRSVSSIFICIFLVEFVPVLSKFELAPAYGNLIIGRENRLFASSTCGIGGQEKFCVVTSLQGHKKCFWCESGQRSKNSRSDRYHGIENVVAPNLIGPSGPSKKPWWQSQTGMEKVSIQLNLETVFYFSYLYLKFKTFRPAGMLVERSVDHGTTWQVYGYFAEDCGKQFPWAPVGEQKNLTVPYCTEKYSSFLPFENGEVILRTLPSVVENTIDPFSEEVQNLVKFTNLRINFTKLHTLGDDLLDNRTDIKEKYYYAIYEMIVGGTCACYGHALRCLPLDEIEWKPNMVHGKCECTHNTKGLNCDKCEDLYNDMKWAPAFGKHKNICKRCECNNHATSCHFDQSVFESTGRVSGGVCDDCQHYTTGRNCEQCKHSYFQDPNKDFTDPYICLPCDCDPTGSLDDGICDSRTDAANGLVSGQCHCKQNVDGRRCDTCKNGFWNLTESNPFGCIPCSCHLFGTHDNQGCNKDTGECTCKRNVVGRDCNQCVPKYWGLGDSPEGCKPCNCDVGGSLNEYCDVITGQCKCRPNLTGRTCNQPVQSYFSRPLDYLVSEAEVGSNCSGTCTIEIRAPYPDNYGTTWTGPGFARINPPSTIDFPIDPVKVDAEFNVVVRYEPQTQDRYTPVQVSLIRPGPVDPNGYCADKIVDNDVREVVLRSDAYQTVAHPSICLEADKNYTVRLTFTYVDGNPNAPRASILIDSVLMAPRIESIPFMNGTHIGDDRHREFDYFRCADSIYSVMTVNMSEICRSYHYSIGAYIHDGGYACECDTTGSYSSLCDPVGGSCNCKPNVIGRRCNYCAPGTYSFGPEGCKACDCHNSGSLDNFCDVYTGQCKCRPQTYGRSCDLCQPGSWNYPNCQRCICQGHADICDSRTGACIDCQNHTEGAHCDRCEEGFYGDPRIGVDIPCRRCPCPGTVESGHSFAQRCNLDPRTQDVICECAIGYSGARCDSCSDNYFGNPEVPGGECKPCNCSNNVDIISPGNCDSGSGKCLKCLYNTDGFNCEYCQAGFFGDALQQRCVPCVCDLLGTNPKQGPCDRFTGQCPCLPNVSGLSCDQCIANHWKIASGSGCEPCACDPNGSESEQCNQYDGQCMCKPGFGGRKCDQCQANFWGNPRLDKCRACECNPEGSASFQCNQTSGECQCMVGMGGVKCDECARGHIGQMPRCSPCGECFDNWDAILNDLQKQTKRVAENATEIMKTGASGSYLNEFEAMEKKLTEVKEVLLNTSASSQKLNELEQKTGIIKAEIITPEQINAIRVVADNVTQRINLNTLKLKDLQMKVDSLNATTRSLKENATKLQEGNVEGALNLTREAYQRALRAKQKNEQSIKKANDAEQTCKRTELLIGRVETQFNKDQAENDDKLQRLTEFLNEIESQIPNLNQQLCGKGGSPCNALCGGAGCGFCGGLSCDEGALTKAESAVQFAQDAEKEIKEKEIKVGELYRGVTQARVEAKNAFSASQNVYKKAQTIQTEFSSLLNQTNESVKQLEEFLNNSASTPAQIRKKAEETQQKTIQLQPEEILDLAKKINGTVASLTNIQAIISNTEVDLSDARNKKRLADDAYEKARKALNVTEKVLFVLEEAEKSQKSANLAVEGANNNTSLAKKSLEEISQASTKAQQNINDTMQQFADLDTQFKALQGKYLENNAAAQKVAEELMHVSTDVSDMTNKTQGLIRNYEATAKELERHASNSTEAFKNAQTLVDKASQLLLNAMKKNQELEEFEKFFSEQDDSLDRINADIQNLTDRIKNASDVIRRQSDYYQTCTT